MNAQSLIAAVLEGETPRQFLLRYLRTPKLKDEYQIGFAIRTSTETEITDAAENAGLTLTSDDWKQLNLDSAQLERNILSLLHGVYGNASDEGHSDDELIGSIWVSPHTPGWDLLRNWYLSGENGLQDTLHIAHKLPYGAALWQNVSQLGHAILDARIDFFEFNELKPFFDRNR